jgi:hypothetical protein
MRLLLNRVENFEAVRDKTISGNGRCKEEKDWQI